MSDEDQAIPFVSVIVPHYNDLENLARCVAQLRRQAWPRERCEIVVADNNSAGGVEAVRRLDRDLRVVPAPLQGAGPARNEAAAVARGEIFAFIDSDCAAEPGWLAAGIAALRRFDYVGGHVVTTLSGYAPVTAAEAYEAVFAFNFKKYIEQDGFSGTGNLFVPRAVFAAVGGFRPGVSEDIDWCRRANALGYRLGYAEDAIVSHAARREWAALTRKWDRVVAERYQLARERAGWRWGWLGYAAQVAASPLPHSWRVLRSRNLPSVRAKLMALIGLFGIRLYRAGRMMMYLAKAPHSLAGRAGT
jgi:GT2 family glycosyltransferase